MRLADGTQFEDLRHLPYAEMRAGCYDATSRLEDLDRAGIAASVCFPSYPGFSGTILSTAKDKELGLACIRAYNDFVLEEWCRGCTQAIRPSCACTSLGSTPCGGRTPANGRHGCEGGGIQRESSEAGFCCDRLAGSRMGSLLPYGPRDRYSTVSPHRVLVLYAVSSAGQDIGACEAGLTWAQRLVCADRMAPVRKLQSFPEPQDLSVRGGIGWIPAIIERCDRSWRKYGSLTPWPTCPELPSSYVADRVFGCFIEDQFGIDNLEAIGTANVMVEVDYPHADGSWPLTQELVAVQLQSLTPELRNAVAHGNAERVFRFPLAL